MVWPCKQIASEMALQANFMSKSECEESQLNDHKQHGLVISTIFIGTAWDFVQVKCSPCRRIEKCDDLVLSGCPRNFLLQKAGKEKKKKKIIMSAAVLIWFKNAYHMLLQLPVSRKSSTQQVYSLQQESVTKKHVVGIDNDSKEDECIFAIFLHLRSLLYPLHTARIFSNKTLLRQL